MSEKTAHPPIRKKEQLARWKGRSQPKAARDSPAGGKQSARESFKASYDERKRQLESELKWTQAQLQEWSSSAERRFILRRKELERRLTELEQLLKSMDMEAEFATHMSHARAQASAAKKRRSPVQPRKAKRRKQSTTKLPDATGRRRKKKSDQHVHRVRFRESGGEGEKKRAPTDEESAADVPEADDALVMNAMDTEPPLLVASSHTCPECGGYMRRIQSESTMACTDCGVATEYLNRTSTAASHGDERSYVSFSYKRSNHFKDWLKCVQGKQSTVVPADVLQALCEKLHEQRVSVKQLTAAKIRATLKTLKMRKHYENSVLIHSILTGVKPRRFRPEIEERLERMFLQIQEPFYKAIADVAPTRKNFLSYAYTCYKLIQSMPDVSNEWLDSFCLLKGRDKLHRQDIIWQHICKQLGWKFIPSV